MVGGRVSCAEASVCLDMGDVAPSSIGSDVDLDLGGPVDVGSDVDLDLHENILPTSDGGSDADLDLPAEPPRASTRIAPVLDLDGSRELPGGERQSSDRRGGDFATLAAAWNAERRQLGSFVAVTAKAGDGKPVFMPNTTSVLSMLKLAFARKAPRRSGWGQLRGARPSCATHSRADSRPLS